MVKIFPAHLKFALLNVIKRVKKIAVNKQCLLSFMGVGEPSLATRLVRVTYDAVADSGFYENTTVGVATSLPADGNHMWLGDFMYSFDRVMPAWPIKNPLPIRITLSLHSSIDEIRHSIMPACRKNTIDETLQFLKKTEVGFKGVHSGRLLQQHSTDEVIMLHYTLIDEVNDSDAELEELIRIGEKYKFSLKLLKFNAKDDMKPSSKEAEWIERLSKDYPAKFVIYTPPGGGIGSSCGQFTMHYYLDSALPDKEFDKWKEKYKIDF